MWSLYQELVLFLQSKNCFRYVPDNDTEGDILGWTSSLILLCKNYKVDM